MEVQRIRIMELDEKLVSLLKKVLEEEQIPED